jgi:hypothetical protein
MSATKVLWGQIVIVFTIVLVTMWAATQWVAWRLGYQPQLGHPWFELISGVPIYLPPSFFWWWYAYDAYAPHVFVEGAYIASSGGFLSIAVAVAMSVWRSREAKTAATYGSARWATPTEIRAAGLTAPDGVVLGKFERNYLRHDGPEHVLCFAPTRSGKGVGLVVSRISTLPHAGPRGRADRDLQGSHPARCRFLGNGLACGPTCWIITDRVPRRQACETWLPASCARWADLRSFGIAQLLLCRLIFVFEGKFVEIGLVAVLLVRRPRYRDGNTVVFNLSRLICCSK